MARSASENRGSRPDVADHDRLAAPARLEHCGAKGENRAAATKWRDAVDIAPGDVELRVVDGGVEDAADAQVLAEQAYGDVLHLGGIAQGADRFVEPEEELIVGFTDLALRDVDQNARGAHRPAAVPLLLKERLAQTRHPSHVTRIDAMDPEVLRESARPLRITGSNQGVDETRTIVRVDRSNHCRLRE